MMIFYCLADKNEIKRLTLQAAIKRFATFTRCHHPPPSITFDIQTEMGKKSHRIKTESMRCDRSSASHSIAPNGTKKINKFNYVFNRMVGNKMVEDMVKIKITHTQTQIEYWKVLAHALHSANWKSCCKTNAFFFCALGMFLRRVKASNVLSE